MVNGTAHHFGPSASTLDLSSGEKLVSPTEGTCKVLLALVSSWDNVNWSYSQTEITGVPQISQQVKEGEKETITVHEMRLLQYPPLQLAPRSC